MRIRETILHSDRKVDGTLTVVKIVTAGDKASSVTMDDKEYRGLVAFASGRKRRRGGLKRP